MTERVIECPHCQKTIVLSKGLAGKILEFLQGSETARATREIYKAFPGYKMNSVDVELRRLKKEGLVENVQYGWWSA